LTRWRGELEAAHKAARRDAEKKPAPPQAAVLLVRRTSAGGNDSGPMKWIPESRPKRLAKSTDKLTSYPADFAIHPKVKKNSSNRRAEMGHGKRPVDYGMAEALAFGTAAALGARRCGSPDRTRGRGTFNQRHAALVDTRTESGIRRASNIWRPAKARCEIYNSTLFRSPGVLGFEYGYRPGLSRSGWCSGRAQFGDFANGAQVIIDQFISAGEDKWDLPSGVVLLLPHGAMRVRGPGTFKARAHRTATCNSPPKTTFKFARPSNARAIFSVAAQASAAPLAQAAGGVHAEEHAAPSRCVFAD